LHDGEITAKREVGHGSEFTLRLPADLKVEVTEGYHLNSDDRFKNSFGDLAVAPEVVEEPSNVIEMRARRPLLLYADDNADLRFYVSDILKNEYQVVLAKNGNEAWGLIKRWLPDVILSDVMMPEVSGLDLL